VGTVSLEETSPHQSTDSVGEYRILFSSSLSLSCPISSHSGPLTDVLDCTGSPGSISCSIYIVYDGSESSRIFPHGPELVLSRVNLISMTPESQCLGLSKDVFQLANPVLLDCPL
jgi:hypothetical protein